MALKFWFADVMCVYRKLLMVMVQPGGQTESLWPATVNSPEGSLVVLVVSDETFSNTLSSSSARGPGWLPAVIQARSVATSAMIRDRA